jgi:hypothetical protein
MPSGRVDDCDAQGGSGARRDAAKDEGGGLLTSHTGEWTHDEHGYGIIGGSLAAFLSHTDL